MANLTIQFDDTGRAELMAGDPLFTAWESIKRDPRLKSTLDKLSVADIHGIMKHVRTAEVEISISDLKDVFERPFTDPDDPRLQCARVLTKSEAEAVLDFRGDIRKALAAA